jgi:xanthine/uracil permease
MIPVGIIGKLAAVFIAIPYPVLGGVQIIGFGIFMGLVMSNPKASFANHHEMSFIIQYDTCIFSSCKTK